MLFSLLSTSVAIYLHLLLEINFIKTHDFTSLVSGVFVLKIKRL